jgi:hypothetical protein
MPDFKRIALRTGASAASLGASALEKAAEAMRGMAERDERTSSATEVQPVAAPSPQASSKPAPPTAVPRRISNPKAARKVRRREGSTRGGAAG